MKMSQKYKGCTDWLDNKDWYTTKEDNGRIYLTRKAPSRIIESFKLFLKANHFPIDTPIFIDEVE